MIGDVGLAVDNPSLVYFRKSPITGEPFAGSVVITLSGGLVFFAYPWDGAWTSGSAGRLNLSPYLTKSLTLHGCSDDRVMLLGGLVADRPDRCFVLTAQHGTHPDLKMQLRMDGGKC